MSDRLTWWTDDGRTLTRCPSCDQGVRLDLHGDRLAVCCFGGCEEGAVLAALDVERVRGEMQARANGAGAAARAAEDGAPRHRTDFGNAERLVAAHAPDLRHVQGIGWLVWDGRRFRRDENGAVMRAAKDTVRRMYAEAGQLEDGDARKELAGWAAKSESRGRLEGMIVLAASEEAVIAAPADLDAQPYLLNVENGTLDLRTGELREHRRSDLLTKLAPVAFDPDARDEAWDRFLVQTTGGDPELAGFLRRAVGYTLTGDTSEEVLFFPHGPEATGKSTLLEASKATLGDYAATADFETFLVKRTDAGPRADIARLAGTRLVTSLEVDDGKRLAEGLVKQLTGGDTVAARYLFADTFEFKPVFTLWLAANTRPRVSADDGALWRRILQVPFLEQVREQDRDPALKSHLKNDPGARAAILAWAMRGCAEWQRGGLQVPDRVRDYTAEYRAENDSIGEWIEACCIRAPRAETPVAALRASYEAWAEENGEKPVAATALGIALGKRGFEPCRVGGARAWRGVELRQDR